jgi:hypothetical protein
MKLSLLSKILIALASITLLSFIIVWLFIRPQYEESILTERLTMVQQLQKSGMSSIDYTIAGWSNVSRFVTSQVTERPNEGETIFRTMMALHPNIIQMRIHSSGLSDELMSQNTAYPVLNLVLADSVWVHSKIDSTMRIAWLNRPDSAIQTFVLQTKFQVQRIPFVLMIVWDAKQLTTFFSDLPFSKDHDVGIYSSSGPIIQNSTVFKLDRSYGTVEKLTPVQRIQEGTISWRVLTSAFQSAQLWMVVAVPEKILLQPVKDFFLYSVFLIVGLMLLMSILGWWLSRHIKQFIEKVKIFYSAPGV